MKKEYATPEIDIEMFEIKDVFTGTDLSGFENGENFGEF